MSVVIPACAMGPDEHRHTLARFFLDTHIDYSPESIRWPALAEPARLRLISLPFWQDAVSTEHETSHKVKAAAQLEADGELRRAIELQGFEEERHARLLAALATYYRIPLTPPPPVQTRSPEEDFLLAGFGECFDSFFAFGLIAMARDAGVFTPELIAIFEPVVQEEARHILFFVNWVRYRRMQLPWWRRPLFRLRCARLILHKVISRMRSARQLKSTAQASGESFTLTAHRDLGAALTVRQLLGRCLEENDRRLARYDSRLLRPRLVPGIARWVFRLLPHG
jgi:hypothetical protein